MAIRFAVRNLRPGPIGLIGPPDMHLRIGDRHSGCNSPKDRGIVAWLGAQRESRCRIAMATKALRQLVANFGSVPAIEPQPDPTRRCVVPSIQVGIAPQRETRCRMGETGNAAGSQR